MNRKQRRADKKQSKPVVLGVSPGAHDVFADALRHHQAGRLSEAERLYRQVLAIDSGHADSLHLLGVIAHQVGRRDLAVELISKAIAINANAAEYHSNLGLTLQEQGRLDEAVACLRQALVLNPGFAQAHNNLGNALKDQGKLDEAVVCYRQALVLMPDHPDAHYNLGIALQKRGQLDEASASYYRALALKPDYAYSHYNLGVIFQAQGKLSEAVACYARALTFKPDFVAAHNNLGIALRDQGKLDEAVESYERALTLKPDFVEAHNNLGNARKDQGKLDEAIACYKRALALQSDYIDAHNNLGGALGDQGKLEEAAASYGRALALKPDYVDAHNNLAGFLIAQGEPMKALDIVRRSLQIRETWEAKRIFADCIKHLRFTRADDDDRATMVRALSEPWDRPKDLALAGAQLVKLTRGVGESVARATKTWPQRLPSQDLFVSSGLSAVSTDPLLRCLLEVAPIHDIELEQFLTIARYAMLDSAFVMAAHKDEQPELLSFHCALAQQCFINDYVFALTNDEADRARSLRDLLAAALKAGTTIPVLWPVVVAAYFPLHCLPSASRLLEKQWPDAVNAVLTQQIREPEEERQYGATIACLTPVEDEVSLLVKRQYEENPYPRWIKAAPVGKAVTIDSFLHQQFPLATFRALNKWSDIDILIAGCGTGQHSIETARKFQGARVLAIDLSLTSLCYAKRKTLALGMNTIEYAQADILKLGSLGRSFDIIESVGVLHHLDDPIKGWLVLLSLLRPGGFMRLGLYSEVARQDIVRARAFIANQGYGRTAEEIRRGRQELVNHAKNAGFEAITGSSDFFSVSECRDLLFHVQEHRLTLPVIDAFLKENHLQFLGFNLESWIVEKYRTRFPEDKAMNDLTLWHVFETENPLTFDGMYQFYIQKLD